jgi:hypothetical protein
MAIVYRHIRLDKNEPFYIGIGKTDRRAFSRRGRNSFWKNIVSKTDYKVEILFENLTQEEACEKEKEFIQLYGRKDLGLGTLVNLTNGGEGTVNIVVSEYAKKIASEVHSGEKNKNWKPIVIGEKYGRLTIVNEAPRRINSNNQKQRRVICECDCKVIKEYTLSRVRNGLTRSCGCLIKENKSKGMLGKKHTEEWKLQASLRGKKFTHTEESKLKMKKPKLKESSRKGKEISEEHRNNIKLSWIKRKEKQLI